METLRIWCSLAERLGMFALKVCIFTRYCRQYRSVCRDRCESARRPDSLKLWKMSSGLGSSPPAVVLLLLQSELEDLCFAVLKPDEFQ